MHRRTFLATAAGVSLMPAAADQLAVNGGTPVRTEPLGTTNWGPLFYDDKERAQLDEVLESRRPFRFANPLDRSKVALFENEYAARTQTKFALAVTSGTAALHTALAALEVGPGDEVIIPAWTW
jgi:8-amino-3,8-dideoxy-alpha-D-manno-octulosonate transaminase